VGGDQTSFGAYSFANVPPGTGGSGNNATYTLTVQSRRYHSPPRTVAVASDLVGIGFIGLHLLIDCIKAPAR
jgi:hypothetical protein